MATPKKNGKKVNGADTFPPNVPQPIVRILFYTDDSGEFGVIDDPVSGFGVGRLRELIENNTPSFVDIRISFLNRFGASGQLAHQITQQLLSNLDEVWFFGTRLSNLTPDEMFNELGQEELRALGNWMVSGGVLMTGDHANPKQDGAASSLDPLLNLGRAIGYQVPRAGQLRRWEGAPGRFATEGNYNTHQPKTGDLTLIDGIQQDYDSTPQRLILNKYPVGKFANLTPFARHRPHPLFCGKTGPIEIFPDHMHEGHLQIPAILDASWPTAPDGTKPAPEIIARGTDKRNGNIYGMVAAYDGDAATAGRIVADSTWHHYFNFNLRGFEVHPDGSPGETLSRLADYYVNLAIWLAPKLKREQMRFRIFWDMSRDPNVVEVKGGDLFTLGRTAFAVLGQSQCQLSELVFSSIKLPVQPPSNDPGLPPEEVLLGGIVNQYQQAFDSHRRGKGSSRPRELIDAGVKHAFKVYQGELQRALAASTKGYEALFPEKTYREPKAKSARAN